MKRIMQVIIFINNVAAYTPHGEHSTAETAEKGKLQKYRIRNIKLLNNKIYFFNFLMLQNAIFQYFSFKTPHLGFT